MHKVIIVADTVVFVLVVCTNVLINIGYCTVRCTLRSSETRSTISSVYIGTKVPSYNVTVHVQYCIILGFDRRVLRPLSHELALMRQIKGEMNPKDSTLREAPSIHANSRLKVTLR